MKDFECERDRIEPEERAVTVLTAADDLAVKCAVGSKLDADPVRTAAVEAAVAVGATCAAFPLELLHPPRTRTLATIVTVAMPWILLIVALLIANNEATSIPSSHANVTHGSLGARPLFSQSPAQLASGVAAETRVAEMHLFSRLWGWESERISL